jgi:hypothetical protein
MSKINLNAGFDTKEFKIFNNGKAGLVNIESFKVEKVKSEDPTKSNYYQIVFTDSKGSTLNKSFFYLNPEHPNFENQLAFQGMSLKHIIHTLYGKDFVLPEFDNTNQMLDSCMALVHEAEGKVKVRIGITYGTTGVKGKSSIYLNLRGFAPFIENQEIPEEETTIIFGRSDLMVRPEKDDLSKKETNAIGW